MTIYDIDREIAEILKSGIDEETGELTFDTTQLEELQMERDRKVENLALACKNLTAEAKAIREEEKALAARRGIIENQEKRARAYLEYVLRGDKFKSPKVSITYRTSKSAVVDEADIKRFISWAKRTKHMNLIRVKDPEINRAEINALLKSGETIKYAKLVETTSMQIK